MKKFSGKELEARKSLAEARRDALKRVRKEIGDMDFTLGDLRKVEKELIFEIEELEGRRGGVAYDPETEKQHNLRKIMAELAYNSNEVTKYEKELLEARKKIKILEGDIDEWESLRDEHLGKVLEYISDYQEEMKK